MSNRQIADRLVLSERTIESHVRSILAKLGFMTRTEVATWVQRTTPALTSGFEGFVLVVGSESPSFVWGTAPFRRDARCASTREVLNWPDRCIPPSNPVWVNPLRGRGPATGARRAVAYETMEAVIGRHERPLPAPAASVAGDSDGTESGMYRLHCPTCARPGVTGAADRRQAQALADTHNALHHRGQSVATVRASGWPLLRSLARRK